MAEVYFDDSVWWNECEELNEDDYAYAILSMLNKPESDKFHRLLTEYYEAEMDAMNDPFNGHWAFVAYNKEKALRRYMKEIGLETILDCV